MTVKKIDKSSKEPSFSHAYEELEQIVSWFDREEVDLEEGLAKFERGLELAKLCQDRLRSVSAKVEEINAKFSELAKEPKASRLDADVTGNDPF